MKMSSCSNSSPGGTMRRHPARTGPRPDRVVAIALALILASLLAPAAGALADSNGTWSQVYAQPWRAYASTILDPIGDRLLVFGGNDINTFTYMNDVQSFALPDGPWTTLSVPDPPPARFDHTAVYDPVLERMIVFGGYVSGSVSNDVWALSLTGTPEWTEVTPAGTPPSARGGAAIIFDPIRNRMLLFGGGPTSSTYYNDLWELSFSGSPEWTLLTPAGTPPSARIGASAIYDATGDRMIVFGGALNNDVWALSLSGPLEWSPISPTGTPPAPRQGAAAAYDPVGDRMIIHGGFGSVTELDDLWSLSLSGGPAWSELTPDAPKPSARAMHPLLYDPARQSMWVYSGYSDSNFGIQDIWALDLDGDPAWQLVRPGGVTPCTECLDVAIYDPVRDRIIVGGRDTSVLPYLPPPWVEALPLSGNGAWTDLGASVYEGSSAIYDPLRDRMVVFGGAVPNHYWDTINDVWAIDLGAPSGGISPSGTPPSPRANAATIYDPIRDRMVLVGGDSGSDEAFELTLSGTPTWQQLSPSGTGPAACGGLATYDAARDRMLVDVDPMFALDLSANAWSEVATSGTPGGGFRVYDPVRDRLVFINGNATTVRELTLSGTPTWSTLTPAGSPPPATYPLAAVYDPILDRVVVQVGVYGGPRATQTWALTFGEPAQPAVAAVEGESAVPGGLVWTTGAPLPVSYSLDHGLSGTRGIEWKLESERDWPGLPMHGLRVVEGGSPEVLNLEVPVPDTAAAGTNMLRLSAWFSGGMGNNATMVTIIGDASALGVGTPGPAALVLEGPRPNPASGALRMSVTLPDGVPASLDAFDLLGRRVASRAIAGAGRHDVTLGEGKPLAPGIYLIRLSHAGASVTRRGVVLQ